MILNKKIGKWYNKKNYYNFIIPTFLDDIAYHFYVTEFGDYSSLPQVTFIYNSNKFESFYKKSERIIKIKK